MAPGPNLDAQNMTQDRTYSQLVTKQMDAGPP